MSFLKNSDFDDSTEAPWAPFNKKGSVIWSTNPSTTVAYRPCTALTHYILWLSSALSAKCAILIHYATVVLGPVSS